MEQDVEPSVSGRPWSYLVIPALKLTHHMAHLREDVPHGEWPDALIFDLEDSVPRGRKSEARELLTAHLEEMLSCLAGRARTFVRVNSRNTAFYAKDMSSVAPFVPRGLHIALSKTESIDDVESALEISQQNGEAEVLPAVETVRGYERRGELLEQASRLGVTRVVFGASDMAHGLGVDRSYEVEVMKHVLCGLLVSARLTGIGIVDSPSTALPGKDSWQEVVRAETEWAWANGAVAKVAIHPDQVPIINSVFHELERRRRADAEEVVRIFESDSKSRSFVSRDTGEYLGTPRLKQALEILGHQRGTEDADA